MESASSLADFDLALRGAAGALILLFIALLVRQDRALPARIGAVLGLAGLAYLALSAPVQWPLVFQLLIEPISAAGPPALWLFELGTFQDDFRIRWHHVGIASAYVLLDLYHVFVLQPLGGFAAASSGGLLQLSGLAFAAAALLAAVRDRGADLVESRRRGRSVFVICLSVVVAAAASGASLRGTAGYPTFTTMVAAALVVFAFGFLLAMLRLDQADLFATMPAPRSPAPQPAEDARLAAALNRAMSVDRLYRDPALTVGSLATVLSVQEYQLRRHINGRLGYRNFNAYVAEQRLAEALAALIDPEQRKVPVLTIALDSGFGSLPPFNRAFKAATGLTPIEYRRAAMAAN